MPTFNTPEPISAVLDIPAGRIQFTAVDRAETAVEVLPADSSKSVNARKCPAEGSCTASRSETACGVFALRLLCRASIASPADCRRAL